VSYEVTVVVPGGGRVLVTRTHPSLRQARFWIATNRETFRGALAANEPSFEAWITDDDGEHALYIRHPRIGFGDDGETLSRAQLREMKRALPAAARAAKAKAKAAARSATNGHANRVHAPTGVLNGTHVNGVHT